jgi:DNA ligase (NAD+)
MRSIPDFDSVLGVDDKDRLLNYPAHCPICGGETKIKDDFLYCTNPNCDGKLINRIDHFIGKKGLDIKGLSKATLQKLINWEWIDCISDIFKLHNHRDEWCKKDGFGSKSVDNILEAIEAGRNCEMWQFISGLSIPLIGSTYAKEIARHDKGWVQFMEDIGPQALSHSSFDFSQWEGFGIEMNKALHEFDYTEANQMIDDEIIILHNSLFNAQNESNNFEGMTFCITGKLSTFKNRDEAKQKIEAAGGKVVDSVSKKTTYLVNNDINSTSSKNQKAKSLNIPIITESQLLEML